jgi:leucyl-tRNA synthetase
MYNVVNPDMIVEKFGADTLRLYEMFLGPVEQAKPWDTNGIDGCHRFLKKFWNLAQSILSQNDQSAPTAAELKSLHKLIKKVTEDIEVFSYNTSIPAFMIATNELSQLKCNKRAVLEPMVILIAPFAPHIAEELWHVLGHDTTVCDAQWPTWNEDYLKESTVKYTVLFNGKPRYNIEVAAGTAQDEVQRIALSDAGAERWLDGKQPKKVIVVPNKIVNVVV